VGQPGVVAVVLVIDVLTEEDLAEVLEIVDGDNWFDVMDIVAVDGALDVVDVSDEDEEDVDETVTVAEESVVKLGNETVVEEDDNIGTFELEEMI